MGLNRKNQSGLCPEGALVAYFMILNRDSTCIMSMCFIKLVSKSKFHETRTWYFE
jgi:hypothetical protein